MESPAASKSSSPASVDSPAESSDPRALPLLYHVSSAAGRIDDPREALSFILNELIATLQASSGSIALLNPDTGKLEIEVQQGLPPDTDEVALRLGQGITGWVAFHGKPQLIANVRTDPRYIAIRPSVRSELAVPMEENGQTVGVINLDHDQINGFTPKDLDLLILCSKEAMSVMSRLWQLRQLKGKARQLESLISIGQSFVTKVEPQDLFDSLTRDTRQIMQVHACALYLYDETAQSVKLAALTNTHSEVIGRDLPPDSCFVSGVIHTRKQLEFANIQGPEFLDLLDIPHDPKLRTLLATPMMTEQEVLGVLIVFTDHVHRFNNDERRLLAALGSLGAVALQNSRLYSRVFQSEESLRKNEQLTTLGLLAAEIAHEIRNPLTVIKLLYFHLGLDFPSDDPRKTDVRVISEKIDQLEAIVSRVLSFAKAPSSLHSRWQITDLIDDTIVLIRLKLAQSKIHLRFDRPGQPLVVNVHKGQIQQVLLNLLINSTQAMPDGGEITLSCYQEDRPGVRNVCIDIRDTGRGVPEPLRDRIFDSFLSGRPDGTGLGLAIAKRILLSHHGDISLAATGPTGTTMRLTLPLA